MELFPFGQPVICFFVSLQTVLAVPSGQTVKCRHFYLRLESGGSVFIESFSKTQCSLYEKKSERRSATVKTCWASGGLSRDTSAELDGKAAERRSQKALKLRTALARESVKCVVAAQSLG